MELFPLGLNYDTQRTVATYCIFLQIFFFREQGIPIPKQRQHEMLHMQQDQREQPPPINKNQQREPQRDDWYRDDWFSRQDNNWDQGARQRTDQRYTNVDQHFFPVFISIIIFGLIHFYWALLLHNFVYPSLYILSTLRDK